MSDLRERPPISASNHACSGMERQQGVQHAGKLNIVQAGQQLATKSIAKSIACPWAGWVARQLAERRGEGKFERADPSIAVLTD